MKRITRRDFMIGGAAFAAGSYVAQVPFARAAMMGGGGCGGGGCGGGGMGGGSTTPIDPPVGALLKTLTPAPNETSEAGVYQVSITARRAAVNVNGRTANLLTYNGQVPGPLIRVRNDQLLRLKFTNALPNDGQKNMLGDDTRITNVHTHGLHVSPKQNMNGTYSDYMLLAVQPGGGTPSSPPETSATYEYDLSMHPPGNLNFYHPHIHGSVADQMWGGMSAPLVIEDPDTVTSLRNFQEQVLVLKDITLSGSEPAPHTSMMEYMNGKEGDTVMVNGQVNPRLYIRPGQVQRWRVVNACTARFFKLSLTGHTTYVIGTDGGLLDKPYPVSSILLSPGERLDLLVKADKAASSYKWLSLPYSRMGNMGGQQVTLMTVTYNGGRMTQSIPSVVDSSAKRVDPNSVMVTANKTMTLSMSMNAGYINGQTYLAHTDCYQTHSMLMPEGNWEIWDVVNNSMMDHPFHHHVNSAQVLSITGGEAGYASLMTTAPAIKDVTIVPKMGRIRLLMPVHDFDGMSMIHCHIIEHEDIGMMGVWHIMGEDGGMGGM